MLLLLLLPLQQTDDDEGVCDCGSNVATIGVVVKLMIDPTSRGAAVLLLLLVVVLLLMLWLLLLLLLLLKLSGSSSTDHVVSHVALHVQSVVGMTGA